MEENNHVEVKLISRDFDLVRDLASDPQEQFTLGKARRIPGFGESIVTLTATLGILTIPAGVAASLLANWIWKHLERKKGASINIEIRYGDRNVELELTGDDAEAVAAAIRSAVINVVKQ